MQEQNILFKMLVDQTLAHTVFCMTGSDYYGRGDCRNQVDNTFFWIDKVKKRGAVGVIIYIICYYNIHILYKYVYINVCKGNDELETWSGGFIEMNSVTLYYEMISLYCLYTAISLEKLPINRNAI